LVPRLVPHTDDRAQEGYEAPDAACCVSNQAELSTELHEQYVVAGYWSVSTSEAAQIVACHCAGKLPLSATGGFVDPDAHILPHATGWGTAENAAFIDELHAGCQSDSCTQSRQDIAQTVAYEPLCSGLIFLGGGCSASTMARADMACTCAMAADRGARFGEELMGSLFNLEYAEYIESMCAYDECHAFVDELVDAMSSIGDEWQALMGMNGLKNCGPDGSLVGAVVGIGVGVLCVLGVVGGLVAIVVVLAKQRRRPNAPNAQPITGVPMAVATSTTVDAVPVATAVSVAPVLGSTPAYAVATAMPVSAL